MSGSFRFKRPEATIISRNMKRYLDKLKMSIYYKDIIISQIWNIVSMTLSNQTILDYIEAHPGARRENIRRHIVPEVSETTVWRALKLLVDKGKLEV